VLFREADVIAERILDSEIAHAPWTQAQVFDHAPRSSRHRVYATHVRDGNDDLDAIAPFGGARETTEVRVSTHRGCPAPEAEDRLVAAQHEVALVIARGLLALDPEAESAVEELRQPEIGNMELHRRRA